MGFDNKNDSGCCKDLDANWLPNDLTTVTLET
jgi:hypothetical protein